MPPPLNGFSDVGKAIPDAPHAVSVSLPSWKANIGYEEGEEWVVSRMKNGYPRFFIHFSIRAFAAAILQKYGTSADRVLLFPSTATAKRCLKFLLGQTDIGRSTQQLPQTRDQDLCVLDLVHENFNTTTDLPKYAITVLSVVLFPKSHYPAALKFWQHTGEGISSRRAEFFHNLFTEGHLVAQDVRVDIESSKRIVSKGPRRYQRESPLATGRQLLPDQNDMQALPLDRVAPENRDYLQFVEERFGRNLDIGLANKAKLAIRRRIAGSLTADIASQDALDDGTTSLRERYGLTAEEVYLYPTGMSAIYNTHRTLLSMRGELKSVMFGFPYIDTLKILEKFGPGVIFYGHGSSADLDNLEKRCLSGERFLALFCEFPSNPLLKSPDLARIKMIADRFDFAVVVDETIGNFLNVNVLSSADVVVSSLTKIFSGDSNVMGGSCVLNPKGRYYERLVEVLLTDYEDNYWLEDAIFMERNSRDFVIRNQRINANAEAVCRILKSSPHVKAVYYPKFVDSRRFYEDFRTSDGGYGGLFSITFPSADRAAQFFDALETAKGPSLGTNFTLSSPFVILAHYHELEWAASFGAEANLIRVSVGMEETEELCAVFQRALQSIERPRDQQHEH